MLARSELNWKQVESVGEALACVDSGLLLNQKDAKRLSKTFNSEELGDIVQVIAQRYGEPSRGKLADEVLSANLLILLAGAGTETPMVRFLESVLVSADRKSTIFKVVENVLSLEIDQDGGENPLKATAVSLICELGHGIADVDQRYPGEIEDAGRILAHIATFLMSVSNSPSLSVRLSLFQYFATREHNLSLKTGFKRVMNRFGHTLLDQTTLMLFEKKTEPVALQYLMENIPYVLEAGPELQPTIYDLWKLYLLKQPERFSLFLKTFTEHMLLPEMSNFKQGRRILLMHLSALLKVASEVNNRNLIQSLLSCFAVFVVEERQPAIDQLLKISDLRKNVRIYLTDLRNANDRECKKVIDSAGRFGSANKRGRKPSFTRVEGWQTIHQVHFLASTDVALKAG